MARKRANAWVRRLAGLAVLALVLVHVVLVVQPPPRHHEQASPISEVLPAPAGDLPIRDLEMSRGAPLDLNAPRGTSSASLPDLHVHPAPPQPPDLLPASAGLEPAPPEAPAGPIDFAAGLTDVDSHLGSGAAAGLAIAAIPVPQMALRPRQIVHPRVPARVIAKRKIDDSVLLQALVASTGRVLDVRILHRIPNCEECTESALEAAYAYQFESPAVGGTSVAAWTVPFDLRFSWRR